MADQFQIAVHPTENYDFSETTFLNNTITDSPFRLNGVVKCIILPSSVTTIDAAAFNNCTSLKDLYIGAEVPPSVGNNAFSGLPMGAAVHVPSGCETAYRDYVDYNTEDKKWFGLIIEDPATPEPNIEWYLSERTSDTTATVRVRLDEPGTLYYEVSEDGAPAPAIDTNGVGQAVDMDLYAQLMITNLEAGEKDIYLKAKDLRGNVSGYCKIDLEAYVAYIDNMVISQHVKGKLLEEITAYMTSFGMTADLGKIYNIVIKGGEIDNTDWNVFKDTGMADTIESVDLSGTSLVINTVPEEIFYRYYNVRKIQLPEGVQTIATNAFAECSKIRNIILPSSLTSIGERAFYYCDSLNSITLPGLVESIGAEAFKYCANMTDITLLSSTPPSVGANAFDELADNAVVYVPVGSAENYKAAEDGDKTDNLWYGLTIVETSTGIVTGIVSDGITPLSGVDVTIMVSGYGYFNYTNYVGEYTILSVPVGTDYTITAEKNGYMYKEVEGVNVSPGEITEVNIVLTATIEKSNENDIKTFVVSGQTGTSSINMLNHTVTFHMPYGTSVVALAPILSISSNATISMASGTSRDFTTPVSYVVTAEDGTEQIWTVTCIVDAAPSNDDDDDRDNRNTGGANPKVDNKKTVETNVNMEELTKAFEGATTNASGIITATLEIKKAEGANAYEITFPSHVFEGAEGKAVEIKTELGTVTMPSNMLNHKITGKTNFVTLTIGKADISGLATAVKDQIGDRPVIELSLMLDGKLVSWNNPDAPVRVSIPYAPTAEELANPENIVVWYIDGSGNVVSVPSGRYDPSTGMVTFTTTHFSDYAVAYVEKTFNDLDNVNWAKYQIEVLASKGILKGISEEAYAPQENITRGDFLYSLVRTLGVDAVVNGNFDDVDKNAYYYKEIAIAKKLGITSGTGNNKFSPDASITRQDMMVLTEKALRMLKKLELQGTASELDKFADKSLIAAYAIDSVASVVKEGLIVGSGDKINPLGNTTRAETAVFLYKIYN